MPVAVVEHIARAPVAAAPHTMLIASPSLSALI